MKMASLFSGSGGFELAALLNGIEPVWASEIEPFPIRVTTKRFPNMKHYGDVSKINGAEVEPVDIITFGSPCQDLSIAGKRKGIEGERSGLFYQAVRIIKEMREATNGEYPKYAIWENVTGAFSSNNGEDFRAVLEGLLGIKAAGLSVPRPERWLGAGFILGDSFSIAWRVLDAQFWGVPQRRKRIYLVADFTGGVPEKYFLSKNACMGILRRAETRGKELPQILKKALKQQASRTTQTIQESNSEEEPCKASQAEWEQGGATPHSAWRGCSWDGGGINPTLTAHSHNQLMPDKDNLGAVIVGADLQNINLTGGWHQP